MRKSYFTYWTRTAIGVPYTTNYFWRGGGVGGACLSAQGLDGAGGGSGNGAYHVGDGEGDGTGDGRGYSSALATPVITQEEP